MNVPSLPHDISYKILDHLVDDRSLSSFRNGLLTCKLFKDSLTRYGESMRIQSQFEKYIRHEQTEYATDLTFTNSGNDFTEVSLKDLQAKLRISYAARNLDHDNTPSELMLYSLVLPSKGQAECLFEIERAAHGVKKTTGLLDKLTFELDVDDHFEFIRLLKSQGYIEEKLDDVNVLFPSARWMSKLI